MATSTPGSTPDGTQRPLAHARSSDAVAEEGERYLAARLARWLAEVAVASAMASTNEELDDAA